MLWQQLSIIQPKPYRSSGIKKKLQSEYTNSLIFKSLQVASGGFFESTTKGKDSHLKSCTGDCFCLESTVVPQ